MIINSEHFIKKNVSFYIGKYLPLSNKKFCRGGNSRKSKAKNGSGSSCNSTDGYNWSNSIR